MKKTLISVTLLLAMALVANGSNVGEAATSASQVDANEKITVYYARVSCPNNCPAYEMTIRPDRSVEFEGKDHTRVLGKRTYKISAEAYQAIVVAVRRAKVEQLKDEYAGVPGRDEGTAILHVSRAGKTKKINHFIPSADVPEALVELEAAIVKNAYPSEGRASQPTPN